MQPTIETLAADNTPEGKVRFALRLAKDAASGRSAAAVEGATGLSGETTRRTLATMCQLGEVAGGRSTNPTVKVPVFWMAK